MYFEPILLGWLQNGYFLTPVSLSIGLLYQQAVRNSFLFFLIYLLSVCTYEFLFNYIPWMYVCVSLTLSHAQIILHLIWFHSLWNSFQLVSVYIWHVLIMFWALHSFWHKKKNFRLIRYLPRDQPSQDALGREWYLTWQIFEVDSMEVNQLLLKQISCF